jgi:hypothetical protein
MLMTRMAGASEGLLGGALVTCPVVTKPEFPPGFPSDFRLFLGIVEGPKAWFSTWWRLIDLRSWTYAKGSTRDARAFRD